MTRSRAANQRRPLVRARRPSGTPIGMSNFSLNFAMRWSPSHFLYVVRLARPHAIDSFRSIRNESATWLRLVRP